MNLAQFWDGRAKDLKEQAGGPIANPGEMASTHKAAVEVLQSIPQYRAYFQKAFGSDQVDIVRVTTAIAAFEETLVTPGSRFDKWLEGDKKALNQQELDGYELFKSSGCSGCHNGPAIGGTLYQKFGVYHPYEPTSKVEGRKAVTGKNTELNVCEVSASMLLDIGCAWVIVGHSERRSLFGETDAVTAAKVLAALDAGLSPILCVGESLAQREAGDAEVVVRAQLDRVVDVLGASGLPVWSWPMSLFGRSAPARRHRRNRLRECTRKFACILSAAVWPLRV